MAREMAREEPSFPFGIRRDKGICLDALFDYSWHLQCMRVGFGSIAIISAHFSLSRVSGAKKVARGKPQAQPLE